MSETEPDHSELFKKPPLPEELRHFTVDWLYPAFHFVLQDQRKKPPLNSPVDLPVPAHVRRPELNTYIWTDAQPHQTFKAFKGRIRSRINHNAFIYIWVYAPNREIALKYIKNELGYRSPA